MASRQIKQTNNNFQIGNVLVSTIFLTFKLIQIKQYLNLQELRRKLKYNKQIKYLTMLDPNNKLSPPLKENLTKLLTYNKKTFPNLVISRLKDPLIKQVSRIQQAKSSSRRQFYDQQLLVLVLNNHVRAIIDLKVNNSQDDHLININQQNLEQYQQLLMQFTQSQQEINRIILRNKDYPQAIKALEEIIQNTTKKNYEIGIARFAQCRLRLLEIIYGLLKSIVNANNGISNIGNNHHSTLITNNLVLKKTSQSFKDLQANQVHLIIQELDEKVLELSTICQQIPQLETFKRTLDLTMPSHNDSFTRIVDVLIELHHKVNKLISKRPEKLLKQIDQVQHQCLIIQKTTEQFIEKLESEQELEIKVLYFDQKVNKSPEHFRKIQKNIVKMSEHMIYCLNMESQYQGRIAQIRNMFELFMKIISNMLDENHYNQWITYKKNNIDNIGDEELKIIQLIDQCIRIVEEYREQLQHIKQQHNRKLLQQQNQSVNNSNYLEEEISLISKQNTQLKSMISEYQQERLVFRDQINELKRNYSSLLEKYQSQLGDYQRKINYLQSNNKSLETENLEKARLIRELEEKLNSMKNLGNNNSKYQQLLSKYHLLQQQKITLAHRLQTLTLELTHLSTIRQQQKSRLQLIIDQFQLENTKFKQTSGRSRQLQNQLKIKNSKIDQLNTKIYQLNAKLTSMLNEYRNMESQYKRKQSDLHNKIRGIQSSNVNNNQLNNTLRELENAQKLVQQLQQELRKKQMALTSLQNITKQLEANHNTMTNQIRTLKLSLQNKDNECADRISIIQRNYANKDITHTTLITNLKEELRVRDEEIRKLKAELLAYNNNNRLTSELDNIQKENNRLKNQFDNSSRQINRLKNQLDSSNRQINRLKSQLDNKNRQTNKLKGQLDNNNRQINRLTNQLENNNRQANKLKNQLQNNSSQINRLKNLLQNNNTAVFEVQITRLKQTITSLTQQKQTYRSKNTELEQSLNQLKKLLEDKERAIKNLQQQISLKTAQLRILQETVSRNQSNNAANNNKQIEYLKQKIRSLEELIEIFTEQHLILEAKIKEYRLKQNRSTEIINRLNSELTQHRKLIESRNVQISELQHSSVSVNQDKLTRLENQLKSVNYSYAESQRKFDGQSRNWVIKQQNYLQQIQELNKKLQTINQQLIKEKSNNQNNNQNNNNNTDKYYLRIEGQKLEQLIHRMQNGSSLINSKVDEILSNSRRTNYQQSITNTTLTDRNQLIKQNKLLILEIRKLLQEKKQAAEIIKQYPNPQYLTQYIFRIIIFFSELSSDSTEGRAIWQELTNIRTNYSGNQYFVVLEDFTKFYLEQNTIQVYRRELRAKTEELELLKQKLDQFFQEKIKSEEILYNKTTLSQSRSKLFRERYMSTPQAKTRK